MSSAARQDQFVSEPISPVADSFDTTAMTIGEPGVPMCFRWRKKEYRIARVVEKWKTTGDCRHGSGEQYVRRHWFRIVTDDGREMVLYFDRQARSKKTAERWWLASASREETP